MIRNFDAIKEQLRELSAVINSFKSEAVQLRLVELVFEATESSDADAVDDAGKPKAKPKPKRPMRRKAAKSGPDSPTKAKGKAKGKAGRPGGKSMLVRLHGEGFFKKAKTIKQIVEHCEQNLALKYKQTDFSGPLGRLTRDGALSRKKNSDKQYEYTQS